MKAYHVYYSPLESHGIHKAENAAKARYQSFLGAKELGLKPKFSDFITRRAAEYDNYNIPISGVDISYIHCYKQKETN